MCAGHRDFEDRNPKVVGSAHPTASPLSQVSTIIPALNEAERIGAAIKSAWAPGCQEVIVVDGGSTDETVEIARGCRCTVIESLAGRAVQQNRGAAVATGDVLLFLHADCLLPPVAVEQIVAALHDPTVLWGALRQRIDENGWLFRGLERGNAARVRLLRLAYGDQGIFVRRSVFEEIGGFPEVKLMEDLLLSRRLRRLGRPALLPGPLLVSPRRWQRRGVLRQTLLNWSLLTAEKLGVHPDRLAKYYCR